MHFTKENCLHSGEELDKKLEFTLLAVCYK